MSFENRTTPCVSVSVKWACGFAKGCTTFGGARSHVPASVVTPADVVRVAEKVPSPLNVGTNWGPLRNTLHGPLRTLKIAWTFVPATVELPVRAASATAGTDHRRPAPIAAPLLVSSPIQRLPPASIVSRLVFPATKEKFEALP